MHTLKGFVEQQNRRLKSQAANILLTDAKPGITRKGFTQCGEDGRVGPQQVKSNHSGNLKTGTHLLQGELISNDIHMENCIHTIHLLRKGILL